MIFHHWGKINTSLKKKVKAISTSIWSAQKQQHLANMDVLTSIPSIKHAVPLTKYPCICGHAIAGVDKYLGHCPCSHTCLMIPLTEVPSKEIHKVAKKQQCKLEASEGSLALLYCLCIRNSFALRPVHPSFICLLCLRIQQIPVYATLRQTNICFMAYMCAQAG